MESFSDSGSDSGFEEVSPGQEILAEDVEEKKKIDPAQPEEKASNYAVDQLES